MAFGVDAGGEVAGGGVGPVEVFAAEALFGGELVPPLLGVVPLGVDEGPEGGGVDHGAVVEDGVVGGVGFAFGAFGVGGGRAELGALADVFDEFVEFGE